ncbi:hypothetical protein ACFQVA_14355 [Actinomadura keratinilytica]
MTQTAAHHFDGSRWKTVDTPLRRFADPVPPEAGAALGTVFAVAPDEVYAYGRHSFNHGEVEDEPDDEELRLRWDGKRWRDLPGAEGACGTRPRCWSTATPAPSTTTSGTRPPTAPATR